MYIFFTFGVKKTVILGKEFLGCNYILKEETISKENLLIY